MITVTLGHFEDNARKLTTVELPTGESCTMYPSSDDHSTPILVVEDAEGAGVGWFSDWLYAAWTPSPETDDGDAKGNLYPMHRAVA